MEVQPKGKKNCPYFMSCFRSVFLKRQLSTRTHVLKKFRPVVPLLEPFLKQMGL